MLLLVLLAGLIKIDIILIAPYSLFFLEAFQSLLKLIILILQAYLSSVDLVLKFHIALILQYGILDCPLSQILLGIHGAI